MQNYNNYGGYQNRMNGYNYGGYGYAGNTGYQNTGYSVMPNQQAPLKTYVNGRAGADAYPLPQGVNEMILWDTESPRFFIKGYDNNGMPRVIEDNDYTSHVEPAHEDHQPDLSVYATKEDIQEMISDAFKNIRQPNLSGYVTHEDLNNALSELCVGNGGKVVRSYESNV